MTDIVKFFDKSLSTVDLSHTFNDKTICWPGGEEFNLCLSCSTDPSTGNFYSAGTINCAEHGGTHVDAPYHFAAHGITVDLLPMCQLIAPCKVIDVSNLCDDENGKTFALAADHVASFESVNGILEPGDIVLIRTGWHRKYLEGAKSYLGFDESIDGPYDTSTSELYFPGIGGDAAKLLVDRRVAAVGLDTGT